ncbi:hypothetical protein GCM10011514_21050 [Emticicia aquatilis]|uniref:Uncharacterized protein n=1 Tax=Emticicia aquatilis TaxID=1537369 RepID=A0A917DNV1_9BACT|nr:hypothetical protein [Emticicia aquatilis]GGD56764.1 hypothetical protein GCM10011514_21050 [Emticicia aquatilis]
MFIRFQKGSRFYITQFIFKCQYPVALTTEGKQLVGGGVQVLGGVHEVGGGVQGFVGGVQVVGFGAQ